MYLFIDSQFPPVCRFLGGVCFSEDGFKAAHKTIYDMCCSARAEDGSKIRIDLNHLLFFSKSEWTRPSMVKLIALFKREMPADFDTDLFFDTVHDLGIAAMDKLAVSGPVLNQLCQVGHWIHQCGAFLVRPVAAQALREAGLLEILNEDGKVVVPAAALTRAADTGLSWLVQQAKGLAARAGGVEEYKKKKRDAFFFAMLEKEKKEKEEKAKEDQDAVSVFMHRGAVSALRCIGSDWI